MKIKTLADLKRIPVGTRLRLVRTLNGPTNKLRIVVDVQSNSIAFDGDGVKPGNYYWLILPTKASNFEPTEKGFRVFDMWSDHGEPKRRELAAEYEFETFSSLPN